MDLTNIGINRDFKKISEVSKLSGVNAIVGCDLYTTLAIREPYRIMSAEKIGDLMIQEIKKR